MPNETGRHAPRDVSRRNLFKQVGLAGAAAAISGTAPDARRHRDSGTWRRLSSRGRSFTTLKARPDYLRKASKANWLAHHNAAPLMHEKSGQNKIEPLSPEGVIDVDGCGSGNGR